MYISLFHSLYDQLPVSVFSQTQNNVEQRSVFCCKLSMISRRVIHLPESDQIKAIRRINTKFLTDFT